MKKSLIIILLFILVLTNIFYTVNAVTLNDSILSKSINNINSILKDEIDVTNPFYLTKILDENNNVPAAKYYPSHIPSRGIKALKTYDEKIFMGVGDWNDNTGPVKMVYYDTKDGQIKSSGTIADEAVQLFSVIDDTLYTTGCDPRADWGYGSYYTYNKEEDKWEQHQKKNGWIHVFNIIDYKDKLFMCGSTVASTKTTCIQSSSDNGETFENVPVLKDGVALPYDNELRCYNLTVYNNKLYGYIYFSPYTGIYEYDEEKNEFNYCSKVFNVVSTLYANTTLSFYNYVYFIKDNFLYVSGASVHKSKDLINFETVQIKTPDVQQDTVVVGDTLYILAYALNSDKTYTTRIYSTEDLASFKLMYEFTANTPPHSIEYHDGSFYIGTAYATETNSKDVNENGSFYKVDLKNTDRSINLNKENKTIEINDSVNQYSVEYDLSNEKPVFKTTLEFDNNMSKKQWEQEYYKLKNLNLIFASVADTNGAVFDKSISYYNDVISKNITNSDQIYTSAIDYAEDMFKKELNIQDELFSITTKKINTDDNKYKTELTLTINKNGDYSPIKPNENNNDNNLDNNTSDENIITNDDISVENSNTIPQAGKFFEFKNLLHIIIFISILSVVLVVIKDKKSK